MIRDENDGSNRPNVNYFYDTIYSKFYLVSNVKIILP